MAAPSPPPDGSVPTRTPLRTLLFGLLAAAASCAPARAPVSVRPDAVEAMARARDARLAGDPAGYLRHVRLADSLAPGHPALLLSLARAYAAAGEVDGAYRVLERLAPYGLAADPGRDTLLAPLRGRAGFPELAARLAAGAAPVVRSDTALVLPDPDLAPESVAHDPATGAFYLGSLSRNEVVRVLPGGAPALFASVGSPGRIIGIRADPGRRRLWAASVVRDTAAPRTFAGTGGRSALLEYDLDSGRLLRRFAAADDGVPHSFNDVALAPTGDVYVTDQFGNAVYHLAPGSGALRLLHGRDPGFHWPNGIDLSPGGERLYVAHLEGISVLDPRNGRRTRLPHPDGVAMADVDGLYACEGALVGVQRMADFEQVTRFRLARSGVAVTGAEVLERRHPAHAQPTTGVVVGSALYYVAASHFARLVDGRLTPAAAPSLPVVLRLPLGGECRPR